MKRIRDDNKIYDTEKATTILTLCGWQEDWRDDIARTLYQTKKGKYFVARESQHIELESLEVIEDMEELFDLLMEYREDDKVVDFLVVNFPDKFEEA